MTVVIEREPPARARERILDAAYALFSRFGLGAVGVDAVIARAGVAKATLYRNFASKDELAIAFLQRREQQWVDGWLRHGIEARATDPRGRILAIFSLFDEWFRRDDFEGCSFINVMLELEDRRSLVRRAAVDHLGRFRAMIAALARDAGIVDADGFARQLHMVVKGSILSAAEGDLDAAIRGREVAELLLAQYGV